MSPPPSGDGRRVRQPAISRHSDRSPLDARTEDGKLGETASFRASGTRTGHDHGGPALECGTLNRFRRLLSFAGENKHYWLLPLVIVFLLLAVLLLLPPPAATPPFRY